MLMKYKVHAEFRIIEIIKHHERCFVNRVDHKTQCRMRSLYLRKDGEILFDGAADKGALGRDQVEAKLRNTLSEEIIKGERERP